MDRVVTYDSNSNEVDITEDVNRLMSQGVSLSDAVDIVEEERDIR